eukprot:s1363_g7.t2
MMIACRQRDQSGLLQAAAEAAEKKRNSKFSSFGAPEEQVPVPAPPPAPNPATAVKASKGSSVMPASWSQADIDEELERQRLEEKATQERRKRDRNRTMSGGKRLSDEEWSALEQLLRSVTSARASVLEAMVFCMDKSDWAIEIAETVAESLTIVETEIPLKVARLLVVSDILHNTTSAKPAAWTYRREFEKSLPDIFEQFEIGLSRSESKIQVAQAKEQIAKILKVWEDWGLFPPQFLRGLEASVMVGVRRLRALASKGDSSREPVWLEPKLADWRRQHFSQLEKMCRARGLRGSTAHLEASAQLSLEEARKEWLIDRLVTYELLAHEKEQARMQAAKEEAAARLARRKSRGMEDIDGEDLADGFPMDDAELDGEPLELSTPGEIFQAVELAKQAPEALASYLGTVGGAEELLGNFVLGAALVESSPSEEVISVISAEKTQGRAEEACPNFQAALAVQNDSEEMLDIQRPEAGQGSSQEEALEELYVGLLHLLVCAWWGRGCREDPKGAYSGRQSTSTRNPHTARKALDAKALSKLSTEDHDRVLAQWRASCGCPISDEAKAQFRIQCLEKTFDLADVRLWQLHHAPGKSGQVQLG